MSAVPTTSRSLLRPALPYPLDSAYSRPALTRSLSSVRVPFVNPLDALTAASHQRRLAKPWTGSHVYGEPDRASAGRFRIRPASHVVGLRILEIIT